MCQPVNLISLLPGQEDVLPGQEDIRPECLTGHLGHMTASSTQRSEIAERPRQSRLSNILG